MNNLKQSSIKESKNGKRQLKPVLSALFSVLLLFLCLAAHAQQVSLSTFPATICFQDFTNTSVEISNLPNGVVVDSVYLDYNSDSLPEAKLAGPGTFFSKQYKYLAPGPYTVTARVKYSNGTFVTQTLAVVVHRLPIADFAIINSRMQCLKGNKVEFENRSVKTDNNIVELRICWGDAICDEFDEPFFGQKISKSYTFSYNFLAKWRVTDSIGCESEIVAGPGTNKEVIIKNNTNPRFEVFGARGCFKSTWLFDNRTIDVQFAAVKKYTWDFGDGQQLTATRPWNLPTDLKNYDSISHVYTKGGTFYPSLIIEDTFSCSDTFQLAQNAPLVPQNIGFTFDITPTLNRQDTFKRKDSACYANAGTTLYFRQSPIDLVNPGEFFWSFGDTIGNHTTNNQQWWPEYTYTKPGRYIIRLNVSAPPCDTTAVDTVEILGPKSSIENELQQILIDPNQKNQCAINQVVEFPNTSVYYKSSRVFRLWDFGDDVAPRCTSYLVPNNGWPQSGGWKYRAQPPFQQLNNSTGYWTMNGKKYPGKRLDCNYSLDTLPAHRYTSWDLIYSWYKDGHDFMPWDFTKYTKNPADTMPNATPKKIWVSPADTLYWGKPVYLNPTTGAFSLTPGSWTDPFSGLIQAWPRIDTIKGGPSDLEPFNKILMSRGTPDPFALQNGEYNIFPKAIWANPAQQLGGLSYTAPKTGKTYTYPYNKLLPGANADKTLYRYIFDREVQKCLTVKLILQDSANNASGDAFGTTDFLVLDSLDCNHETTVQLALTKPDARGLGKSGKECAGSYSEGGNGIQFHLGAVSGVLGNYPGVNPNCGQTFILLNHDSLADRMDNTPCVLDGFVDWQGGTTAGGLLRPPFSNAPDWRDPKLFWQAPTGTSTWYHYGPGTVFGGNNLTPADPDGNVTVGLVIGSGNAPNICISDTVWYHNFLSFKPVNAKFFVDPTYGLNGVVNGACKLYKPNSEVTFVYADSLQESIKYSAIYWGDNQVTVDSFWYQPGANNGIFVNGVRRVRYHISYGKCGTDNPVVQSIPFPNGLPGVLVDTIWKDNYTHRLYSPTANPLGTLFILGPNSTNDSVVVIECAIRYSIAYTDTLKKWYNASYRDRALMFLPVKHRFSSTSWENDCMQSNATPDPLFHIMESVNGCQEIEVDNKLLVRGVIDTVKVKNQNLNFDTIFCVNEPVHFYDSVRYWRPDCSLSDVQLNPNQQWGANGIALGPLDAPWSTMHIDTADYWKKNAANTNTQWPDGSYVEKLKWYFGDGDSAVGPRPVHLYRQAGQYVVLMLSRDKTGNWDTATAKLTVQSSNIVLSRPNPLTVCETDSNVVLPAFGSPVFGAFTWSYPPQPQLLVYNAQQILTINPRLLTTKPTTANPISLWLHVLFHSAGSCAVQDSMLVTVYASPTADSISGPKTGLFTTGTYTYAVPQQLGLTYQWTVTNGTILNGQGTNSINVQWLNNGQGKLVLKASNQQQCSDTSSLSVSIGNVGLNPLNQYPSLSIYPNPTSTQFTIADNEGGLGGVTIIILDMVGRVVKEVQVNDKVNQIHLNVAELTRGTYQLWVKGNNKVGHFKLVKE